MMKRETFAVDTIYVRVGRRTTLDPKRVEEIAHSMLADGQKTPILVRPDGARFVLVEGLHRLEAAKAFGNGPSSASASTPGSTQSRCSCQPPQAKPIAIDLKATMLSDTIKTLIRNAWDDGYPCLVATNGPQGPNISPKGSMLVFDDQHLA